MQRLMVYVMVIHGAVSHTIDISSTRFAPSKVSIYNLDDKVSVPIRGKVCLFATIALTSSLRPVQVPMWKVSCDFVCKA
jgi:hypothetical protein